MALSGMSGRDTLSRTAVSVRGKVRQLGSGPLPRLLQKNPYMLQIYPTAQSRRALTVFQMYQGQGEWFDLSRRPIERFSFTFGGAPTPNRGVFYHSVLLGLPHMRVRMSAGMHRLFVASGAGYCSSTACIAGTVCRYVLTERS